MGFLIACFASFLYLAAVRIPLVLRVIVWTSIFAVLSICLVGSAFMLSEARKESNKSDSPDKDTKIQIQLMTALGAFLAAFGFLWLCLAIYLRKKIGVAIDMIRQTSKAILDMPILMFFPFLTAIIICFFTIVWVIYCTALATSGEIKTITETTLTGTYEYKRALINNKTKKALLFVSFMWIWTLAFIQAGGQFISAHSVLMWLVK